MVIITLTDCPQRLRGDLSKWLFEINTGVFVGKVSARVREELWARVCENAGDGKASMVFNTSGEQKLDFRVYNTSWKVVDLDGIKIVKRPKLADELNDSSEKTENKGFSRAAKFQKARRYGTGGLNREKKEEKAEEYVVIDIETTGLSVVNDSIIEVAALHIVNGEEINSFSSLVLYDGEIPDETIAITGIDKEMLIREGRDEKTVLKDLIEFVGKKPVVAHNAPFDMNFIRKACKKNGISIFANKVVDTLVIARRSNICVDDYKLSSIANYFEIPISERHRALADCRLTRQVFEKLKGK